MTNYPWPYEEFVDAEAQREGTSVVIGPPGVPGAVPPSETKGLEFDAVLVVDPDRILAAGPRGAGRVVRRADPCHPTAGSPPSRSPPQALSGLAGSRDALAK